MSKQSHKKVEEIATAVAAKTGFSKRACLEVINSAIQEIKGNIENGNSVHLPVLGVLYPNTRNYRNPLQSRKFAESRGVKMAGEREIPSTIQKMKVKFDMSATWSKSINK